MRGWILLVVVAGCTKHEEPRAKVEKGSDVAPQPPSPPPAPATPADRLVDRLTCAPAPVPAASWVGRWSSERPIHREVTIAAAGDQLSVSEGLYTVETKLDPDGIVARGHDSFVTVKETVSLETHDAGAVRVTTRVSVAACFDVHKALHLWRVLDSSGGSQPTHMEDEVVLAQVP